MRPWLTWRRMLQCKDVAETSSEILEQCYVIYIHTMTFKDFDY